MKKLLVLMLVLGMASLASAALSLTPSASTVVVGNSITIDLGDSSPFNFVTPRNYVIIVNVAAATLSGGTGTAELTTAEITYGVSANTFILNPSGTDGAVVALLHGDFMNTGPITLTGNAVDDFSLLGVAVGTATIDVYALPAENAAFGSVLATTSVTVTPEPMTLALLGIGGLFLRRKK